MGTPSTLTGTAVAIPDDPDSQLRAYELASIRLHAAAEKQGVFIGEPTFETLHAAGAGKGHQIIVVTAPVLSTGMDTHPLTRRSDQEGS